MMSPEADHTLDRPAWSIGDRVIFKPMYGSAPAMAASARAVYEVRGVDGGAVWLRREGAPGHITAGAAWLAPVPKEDHT